MWSDNETAVDLLGFQHLVAGVNSIACNDSLLPATIGVFGDWGSGKSSLLQIATSVLKKDDNNLVLSFNGWLFEDYGDAKAALMGNILDALAEDKTLTADAKALAVKLLRRVNWWRVVGAAAKAGIGLAAGGPAGLALIAGGDIAAIGKDLLKKGDELKEEDLTKYLKESPDHEERRSIREFREDFAKLLGKTKHKRLIVVIDDLDRCLPDTIIATLEAIKLFLFVEHTAFIVGADERLVQYAVRQRFPELPGERSEVGRDYLEKLIQFPIRVPPLGRVETERYISLLFAERADLEAKDLESLRDGAIKCDPTSLHGLRFNQDVAAKVFTTIPEKYQADLSLAERIAPILASETLGNPRQCKRFLNMLSIRLAMADSRGVKTLQPRILAKLMLLEYYRNESFRQLAAVQAEEEGKPSAIARAEKQHRLPAGEAKAPPPTVKSTSAKGAKSDDDAVEKVDVVEDLPLWLLDSWVTKWIAMEPALADEDLRPYFYFSRDSLGVIGIAIQRMSPAAQEAFRMLMSDSDAERRNGLKRAASLSPADASAVFEGLAERVRMEDDFNDDNAVFPRIIDWTKSRPEIAGQLAALLASFPHDRIPVATPLKLVPLNTGGAESPIGKLFAVWSASSTGRLKAATETAMKRQQGR
ncbi:MAG TPA: P-loop NTPase fold protein [Phycisphaerae bacterium]|nr:P-loop NTPase fold protein [Phycisphaerae bacterium]